MHWLVIAGSGLSLHALASPGLGQASTLISYLFQASPGWGCCMSNTSKGQCIDMHGNGHLVNNLLLIKFAVFCWEYEALKFDKI